MLSGRGIELVLFLQYFLAGRGGYKVHDPGSKKTILKLRDVEEIGAKLQLNS